VQGMFVESLVLVHSSWGYRRRTDRQKRRFVFIPSRAIFNITVGMNRHLMVCARTTSCTGTYSAAPRSLEWRKLGAPHPASHTRAALGLLDAVGDGGLQILVLLRLLLSSSLVPFEYSLLLCSTVCKVLVPTVKTNKWRGWADLSCCSGVVQKGTIMPESQNWSSSLSEKYYVRLGTALPSQSTYSTIK
jgi:hypothetical protein